MTVLRKVALGLLLTAATAVILLAAVELWNYRQWAYLPSHAPGLNDDNRALVLQDRMELLSTRVKDMEMLVLILFGTTGFYTIVVVIASYLSTTSFSRQADQTISQVQDQIGLAMGDLRELQERTEQSLREMLAASPAKEPERSAPAPAPADHDQQIAAMTARLAAWQDRKVTDESKLALLADESAAAHLDAVAGSAIGAPLPTLYLGFARIYAKWDAARARFYLDRALRLAPPKSALASEIHYEMACRFAASQDFAHAITELTAAFEHQFKALEERLANDIEEGGQLYELASTPPYDKAVNDLLLNMSIGIG